MLIVTVFYVQKQSLGVFYYTKVVFLGEMFEKHFFTESRATASVYGQCILSFSPLHVLEGVARRFSF